ncbi:MAG: LuxR C-terminal-related transcriptional regulator [Opitutaceae bacterium]
MTEAPPKPIPGEVEAQLVVVAASVVRMTGCDRTEAYFRLCAWWRRYGTFPGRQIGRKIGIRINIDHWRSERKHCVGRENIDEAQQQADGSWRQHPAGIVDADFGARPGVRQIERMFEEWEARKEPLLAVLTARQREVVGLRLAGKLTGEIARELRCSESNVSTILTFAITRMRHEVAWITRKEEEKMRKPGPEVVPTDRGLTDREREVAILMASGFATAAIIQMLSLSRRTIENHRAAILRKIEAPNVAGVTRYVLAHGWIENEFLQIRRQETGDRRQETSA